MLMPGRNFNAPDYRFGFNSKEKDDEWHGITGSIYNYGQRMYMSRLCRFMSVDLLFRDYPFYTPYSFAGNKPIWAIDLDGLEELKVTGYFTSGSFAGRFKLFGAKFGGEVKYKEQEIFRYSIGYDIGKKEFFSKVSELDKTLETGISVGYIFGFDYSVETDLATDKKLSEKFGVDIGVASISESKIEGTKTKTGEMDISFGGKIGLIFGIGVEAGYTSKERTYEEKSYTIDEMLEKGWTVPAQAIEFNKQQKEAMLVRRKKKKSNP